MTVDILICTIDEGILKVPQVLMSPRSDVRYVVSMQYTAAEKKEWVPEVLKEREDVDLVFLEGKGLSRNRNNALAHAKGDVVVMADDDNRYKDAFIRNIVKAYETHPEADVICFQALNMKGEPLHLYTTEYVCSVEMTWRKRVGVRFDERFGLGGKMFCAGEEQVWMKDAERAGYHILYMKHPIVMTPSGTTGEHFLGNKQLQVSKGATFRYVYGTVFAFWRTLKEAGWWMVHQGANPFPIMLNMMKGANEVGVKKDSDGELEMKN